MKLTIKAIAAASVLFAGAAHAETLKVCAEGAYPPFSKSTESGDLEGFDIDIAKALCDELEMTCEISATEWDGIIPALLEKKCDAIVASMSITEDRKKVIDFSKKYYSEPNKFIARADTELKDTPEGLADAVVGVQGGTIHDDYMSAKFPDVKLKRYGSQDEVYLDLQAGRLDAAMQGAFAASDGFLKAPEGATYAFFGGNHYDEKIHGEGAGIGVRKEDIDLRNKLSGAINAIRANGKYKEINDKYFDFDIY